MYINQNKPITLFGRMFRNEDNSPHKIDNICVFMYRKFLLIIVLL